jgi:hypothetical protein
MRKCTLLQQQQQLGASGCKGSHYGCKQRINSGRTPLCRRDICGSNSRPNKNTWLTTRSRRVLRLPDRRPVAARFQRSLSAPIRWTQKPMSEAIRQTKANEVNTNLPLVCAHALSARCSPIQSKAHKRTNWLLT